MKQYEILIKDTIVAQHIPETKWYNHKILRNMLSKYSTIYLKPNNMSSGNGIIRLKHMNNNKYKISFEKTTKIVEKINLVSVLKEIMVGHSKYIIQQGIDLATYNNKPFDMRIVLQKVVGTWRITLTSAKVATSQDAIVTNVSKGADHYLLHRILGEYDQKKDTMATFREVIDLSHQITNIIGNQLPITIAGLDMAIDKSGKVWFIECNEKPECGRCKLVNDKRSIQKYEQAKKIIKGIPKQKK